MQFRKRTNWPAAADRLAGALPPARLHPAVLQWVKAQRGSAPWGVAFSGGADSVALLLLLWAHWPDRRGRLVALHFDHRLRGQESAADAAFCRRVAAALGIRVKVGAWKSGRRVPVSEAAARAARQEFFRREMQKLGTRVLWLAHQQNDVAESLLMRLARGSGTGGLAAPRPVQDQTGGRVFLRPLLNLKRNELTAALAAAGAGWREDSSNASGDFFRNRVRARVLPAWVRAAGRDALAGAGLARERLEEDDDALEAWVDRVAALDRRGRLDLAALAGAPRAVTRRSLHRWMLALPIAADLARQGFEALLALVERGRPTRFSLGRGGFAVIRAGKLEFKEA